MLPVSTLPVMEFMGRCIKYFFTFSKDRAQSYFYVKTDLAAEGVAVQGPELGVALHARLRHLSVHGDGCRVLEQHSPAHDQRGQLFTLLIGFY